METQIVNATEYREVSLSLLTESKTNPRRVFENEALKELAATIRTKGVYSPLLVRPLTERGFEIVFGARRFRAAQMAEAATVPVRIKEMTDAEVIEAQLIENLQRKDVHPMEEAQGFRALLNLEEPTYTVEQIAAKMGKSPAYVTTRLKLTDLAPVVIEAFYAEEIGVGHALLLAKLQADQQEQALSACFKEVYNGERKPTRILLPVRNLQFWIDTNIILALKDAPFDRRDAQLVPAAGSCVDCPKRTGHNKLLFSDIGGKLDSCTDPTCYQSKVAAHVADRDKAKRPEFKSCKFTTDAIVTDGTEVGTMRKVCTNAACPVHHPKPQRNDRDEEKWKAEQEKRRREEAIANTTGLRVLTAISAAVPVRLMKRDLLFINTQLAELVGEPRLEALAKQHGIKRSKDTENIGKVFAAYLRRADEGTLSRVAVALTIVLAAARTNAPSILREAATVYKVDTDAIAQKVKAEFAAKAKAKKEPTPTARPVPKAKKAA
ncbi:ParB/RepB/Spo0J family partition protein [Terriglobus tenax]|uniref:ParB/RepB/Spo0J family partition protein n=1 Tax=Terriglobus tenax TaxID=1111115 RepID=UPI0021E039D2|nr:ParB/RepB/Spo0J family partition protein [Terriglobus tenax]